MNQSLLSKIFSNTCIYCGVALSKSSDVFCNDCMQTLIHAKSANKSEIISVLDYKDKIVKAFVLFMKDYKDKEVYKLAASLLLVELLEKNNTDFSEYTIVYAPRNLKTYIKKGFDQSKEIGKMLSLKLFGTKKHCKSVFCTTMFAKEQKTLTSSERKTSAKRNLSKIPFVKMPKRVIIIDDVTTTGSTLYALKEIAEKHGAESCILCSIASE